jgi:hypothetical protein
MTQAPAPSLRKRIGPVQPAAPDLRPALSVVRASVVSELGDRRRAGNRKNIGLATELRCECSIPSCRETFPAAAVSHRGAGDRLIIAPAHLNGDTAVKVADRFFVIEPRRLVGLTEGRPRD